MFAYTVTIKNTGESKAQLISRHWIITDATKGRRSRRTAWSANSRAGARRAFEYTSGCPLETPVGSMRGTYRCVAADGTAFEASIPEFVLAMPRTLH